jgi:hypothetical protein
MRLNFSPSFIIKIHIFMSVLFIAFLLAIL